MTVLTASAAFDAAALQTLLDINSGSLQFHLVNTHLIRLTGSHFRYDIGGTFTNPNINLNHATSLTLWDTTAPLPDVKLYSMTGFNVTVGQVKAANTPVKLENLFFK